MKARGAAVLLAFSVACSHDGGLKPGDHVVVSVCQPDRGCALHEATILLASADQSVVKVEYLADGHGVYKGKEEWVSVDSIKARFVVAEKDAAK